MRLYCTPDTADPEWLARASMFHGHLGPWLVTGLLVGRNAVERLETPGQWFIDVTCWMPLDKQRTPFSCLLDGLQASTGATLGKQNIRFAYSEEALSEGWPVIYITRRERDDRPAEGLVYVAGENLHRFFATVTPERLEECSRELAAQDVARLFHIAPMSPEQLMRGREVS